MYMSCINEMKKRVFDQFRSSLALPRLFMRFLTCVFLLLLTSALPMNGEFGGGVGTIDDPLVVEDVYDLQAIGATTDSLTLHYIQLNDIDASDTSNSSSTLYNDGAGFLPIGKHESLWELRNFTGSYLGNDHVISGLYINRPAETHVALFGSAFYAPLEGIVLEDVNITGSRYVGALTGWSATDITNCSSSGIVIGTGEIEYEYDRYTCATGGLTGWNETCYLRSCHSSCEVIGIKSRSRYFGGLVGNSNAAHLENCTSSGNVTSAGDHVGGLSGCITGWATNCESFGDVIAENRYCINVGGLGGFSYGYVIRCVAHGNAPGGEAPGGLIGCNCGTIEESWSTGDVGYGGLAGINAGYISHSYSTGYSAGGGLVGRNDNGILEYSYAMGGAGLGGLVALSYDEGSVVRDCLWNSHSHEPVTEYDGPDMYSIAPMAKRCRPADIEEFRWKETFDAMSMGWDMSPDFGVWYMIEGRTPPLFRWKAKKDIKESLLGARLLTLEDKLRLDVNDDGIIDIADLVMLGE